MNSRIFKLWRKRYVILLMISISYHIDTNATFGEHVIDAPKYVYHIVGEKTRTWYKEIKKHKKLVAGVVSYLAFEVFGYYYTWDTPLRRLFILPSELAAARAHLNAARADNQNLTRQLNAVNPSNQKEIEILQQRCEELENQVATLNAQIERRKQLHNQIIQDFNAEPHGFEI